MNSNAIKLLLESYVPRDYVVGVYPLDRVPTEPPRRSCLVVNSDPAGEPGTHWLALFVGDKIEFFDSFGQEPGLYSLTIPSALLVLNAPIQSLNSDLCGEHCVLFLKRRADGDSLTRIRSSYSRDHPTNDFAASRQILKLTCKLSTDHPSEPCDCVQCAKRRCLFK